MISDVLPISLVHFIDCSIYLGFFALLTNIAFVALSCIGHVWSNCCDVARVPILIRVSVLVKVVEA